MQNSTCLITEALAVNITKSWRQTAQSLLQIHGQGQRQKRLRSQRDREQEKESEMAGNEEWRKRADTHKMTPEEVKAAGVEASKRPPGQNPGTVLHQRRSLPFNLTTMTVAGLLITAAIGYFTLYTKKKPQATARDVAKVTAGVADPEDTHPKK